MLTVNEKIEIARKWNALSRLQEQHHDTTKDSIKKASEHHNKMDDAILQSKEVVKVGKDRDNVLNKEFSNNWTDVLLAIPQFFIEKPLYAAGSVVALGATYYGGKWFLGQLSKGSPTNGSSNLSAPTTTNITINNITKSIEDI
jgi:hypothetical protein